MKNIFRIALFSFFILNSFAFADSTNCKWCVFENPLIKAELLELSKKTPLEQLQYIRSKGNCVVILDSKRPVPKNNFHWNQIETAKADLSTITKLQGLFGKTLCKGEHKTSNRCDTIALASDAPKSTLLHEWLHLKQIQSDPSWCATSKKLWARTPTTLENQTIRDKEWDVHRLLWKLRDDLNINLEDKLTIGAETLEESNARSQWDATAKSFTAQEKMVGQTQRYLLDYQKQLITNKR